MNPHFVKNQLSQNEKVGKILANFIEDLPSIKHYAVFFYLKKSRLGPKQS